MPVATTPEPEDNEEQEPKKELARTDSQENAIRLGNQPLDLKHLTLAQLNYLGKTMAESGMFTDAKDAPKALVKILAGQEIGITPFQAMTNINIIQGKPALGANLYAAKVKSHPKYDYRSKLSSEECTITIFEKILGSDQRLHKEELGSFTYSMDDAKNQGLAGKDNWKKYPQNMLFARAISNAVRLFAPDVFSGNVMYTPEELGVPVNEEGDAIIEGETVSPKVVKGDITPEGELVIDSKKASDDLDDPSEATKKRGRALLKELGYGGDLAASKVQSILHKPAPVTETDWQTVIADLEVEKESVNG